MNSTADRLAQPLRIWVDQIRGPDRHASTLYRRPPPHRRLALGALLAGFAGLAPVQAAEPIRLGLVTALSGQSAKSGEAISRGIGLAIDEINKGGGVLGRPLELVARDDEANPSKGVLAARELIQRAGVVALIGGLDTPVSMAIVPIANQMKAPFVGPWAAGTGITRNGAADNYVFRVSAVDALVDEALVAYAVKTYGPRSPARSSSTTPGASRTSRASSRR